MAAKLLDGAAMALEVEKELKQQVDALREHNVVPGLCVILVGNDPASQTYVANKEKACARLGIHSQTRSDGGGDHAGGAGSRDRTGQSGRKPFTAFWYSFPCPLIWTSIGRWR